MENLKFRVIYEYEFRHRFRRGTSAAETGRRINDVYGSGVARESTVVISNKGKENPAIDNDEDVQHIFAKLLKSIIKVNEVRMHAMEKVIRLQDYMLTKNKLKTSDYEYDSVEEDSHILLAFADMPQIRRADETITRAICNRLNLERNNNNLRKSLFWKLICHSHSIRSCESACKKSVRKVCKKFHCNNNSKRGFRTECHKNCFNQPLV